MEFLIVWALLCVGAGILANRYRRNPIGWFFLSLAISPLIGFVFLLAAGPAHAEPVTATRDEVVGLKREAIDAGVREGWRVYEPGEFIANVPTAGTYVEVEGAGDGPCSGQGGGNAQPQA
jgi:hypothetical protein